MVPLHSAPEPSVPNGTPLRRTRPRRPHRAPRTARSGAPSRARDHV